MKASHTVTPVFDDPNLVSAAGLVPVMRLAETAGLHELLENHLSVESPNPAVKSASIVAGMLAGADSIDDLDVLRHGAMGRLFGGVRAPSTLGTHLRTFTHGHVQQLDAVAARLLTGLTARVPDLIAGADQITFLDVDDTIREVHGYAKAAAAFAYSGVRGLNVQVATVSTPTAAPVIARARLRRGNVASPIGAGRLLAQAIATARAAGVSGQILARADSAHFGHAFVGAAIRAGAWFSVTARMNPQIRASPGSTRSGGRRSPIRTRSGTTRRTVGYRTPKSPKQWSPCSPRGGRPSTSPAAWWSRRVKRLNPAADAGQEELFATHRHHAFVTNSTLTTVEADARHRDHAIVEQAIAELKDGPLAHLPSGKYAANAAWLAHAVIAFNLARAAGVAASPRHARARWATLRTHLINIPARVASSGRRLTLHLPTGWSWESAWRHLFEIAGSPSVAAT